MRSLSKTMGSLKAPPATNTVKQLFIIQSKSRKTSSTKSTGNSSLSSETLSGENTTISTKTLIEIAPVLVQMRMNTFYRPFFTKPSPRAKVAYLPAVIYTQPILNQYDWEAIFTALYDERAVYQRRSDRKLLTLLPTHHNARLHGLEIMKSIRITSTTTGLPERQIIAAVESYALYKGATSSINASPKPASHQRRQTSRNPEAFDAKYLAAHKQYAELATFLLNDAEDHPTYAHLLHTNIAQEISAAIRKCSRRYFSTLTRQRDARHYRYGWIGRKSTKSAIAENDSVVYSLSRVEDAALEGEKGVTREMAAHAKLEVMLTPAMRKATSVRVSRGKEGKRKGK